MSSWKPHQVIIFSYTSTYWLCNLSSSLKNVHKCACTHVLFCISPINFIINKSLTNMYPCSLILSIPLSPFPIYSAKLEPLLSLSSLKLSMLNLLSFLRDLSSLSLSLSLSGFSLSLSGFSLCLSLSFTNIFCSLKQYLRPRKTFDNWPWQGVNIGHLSIFVKVSK